MDPRTLYLLQVLETIGKPLMAAVIETSKASGADAATRDAQSLAAMLGKVVQASIDLGQVVDVNPVEAGDDSLRVALAGLASPLVAGQMKKKGGLPDDLDVKRVVMSLQAVLTFADNFSSSMENTQRLADLIARGQIPMDGHQVALQYVEAMTPVVQAIAAFSFGQPEQKLIVDVTGRLVGRAAQMRKTLLPDTNPEIERFVDLGFLKALGGIYSACHAAEVRKARGAEAQEEAGPSLEGVWAQFDLQAGMLETLCGYLIPGLSLPEASLEVAGSTAPAQAAVVSEPSPIVPPVFTPVQEAPKAPAASVSPSPPLPPLPVQPEAPVQPPVVPVEASAGANPMAMFAKPKDNEESVEAPSAVPSAVSQPPAPPIQPEAAPLPMQASDEGQGDEGDSAGGSPMSFFKKGDA
ncbi:MAG: hypothetical protein KDI46_06360 [Alphaproteobacteria bacterium]|nr:hypothetical protein [Alphaproteobacteria bacterium]